MSPTCARRSTRRSALLELAKPVEAPQAITDDMVREVEMPARWAPLSAMRDAGHSSAVVPAAPLSQGLAAAGRHAGAPPQLAPGPARAGDPGRRRDRRRGKIGPTRGRHRRDVSDNERKSAESRVVVPNARIVEVGAPRVEGGRGVSEQDADPSQVVPVTFALTPEQVLVVSYAETNAAEVRLALLRPGDESTLTAEAAHLQPRSGPGARAVSHRLLLAIADRDVASSAAALAQEGDDLEVVGVVDEAEEVTRMLRRHDVDVVVLHDALGAVTVLDLARRSARRSPRRGSC